MTPPTSLELSVCVCVFSCWNAIGALRVFVTKPSGVGPLTTYHGSSGEFPPIHHAPGSYPETESGYCIQRVARPRGHRG